jgi:DNA invertase Pin-like site-specific DNA recombinase
MSGAKASRPELTKALARVRRGDVLVVARFDRLARLLSHLLCRKIAFVRRSSSAPRSEARRHIKRSLAALGDAAK